ncbi:hypothetical protein LCGC14_2703380 [marine sediment metagenome]|uniref:Uncharacterized protein n=1 Tax=marine sediment metagenome TaxID=412755 RepID=A0A0F8ZF82_9ZZZZ
MRKLYGLKYGNVEQDAVVIPIAAEKDMCENIVRVVPIDLVTEQFIVPQGLDRYTSMAMSLVEFLYDNSPGGFFDALILALRERARKEGRDIR